jgi:hypothetical protein
MPVQARVSVGVTAYLDGSSSALPSFLRSTPTLVTDQHGQVAACPDHGCAEQPLFLGRVTEHRSAFPVNTAPLTTAPLTRRWRSWKAIWELHDGVCRASACSH